SRAWRTDPVAHECAEPYEPPPGQPSRPQLIGQPSEVDAGLAGIAIRIGQQVAVRTDVEIPLAPVRRVVSLTGLLDIPLAHLAFYPLQKKGKSRAAPQPTRVYGIAAGGHNCFCATSITYPESPA